MRRPVRLRALVLLVLCAAVLFGCRRRPEAARLAFLTEPPPVEFVWTGALTPTSVRLAAGLRTPSDGVHLVLTPGPDSLPVVRSDRFTVPEGGAVVHASLEHLAPGVVYRTHFEIRGDTLRGASFRTPEVGPFSYDVALGACAMTGSEHPVFDAVREAEPLFFLHLGDLHYENIAANGPALFREAFGRVLRSRRQAELYRSTPIAYVWDDHDFGPNDADRTSPGREAARRVYRELVPHYPLPAGPGDAPIYQAFSVGRVRFILTDLRSERDPKGHGTMAERSMLGAEQKDWFKRELLAARDRYPVIAWVSTVPWIGAEADGSDHWGGYAAERREIADFLKANEITNVVILAGDAHMVALDDGTNSDYATGGGAPVPVVHSAPLDRQGSVKGGPYTLGPFANTSLVPPHDGQWVRMSVHDEGGAEVCLGFEGFRIGPKSGRTRQLFEWGRCFSAADEAMHAPFWSGADTLRIGPRDALGDPPRIAVRVGGRGLVSAAGRRPGYVSGPRGSEE